MSTTSDKKQKTPPEDKVPRKKKVRGAGARDKTPPQVAREWGCKPAKIIAFIKAGLLPGYDVSSPGSKSPRFLIEPEGITIFKNRRAVGPAPKVRRRRKDERITEYFK